MIQAGIALRADGSRYCIWGCARRVRCGLREPRGCAGPTVNQRVIHACMAALLEHLADSCDHQPFITKGKLVLVFCADCLKWYDAFVSAGCVPRRPGPGDLLLAVDDALIAAQNAVVAAQSLGIGSCYIGDIMENIETQRELLNLPEHVFPAALLVFGYPTEQQKARKKPERVDMRYIVQENWYHRMDGTELREMFNRKAADGDYGAWMRAFCQRKYNSDFAREMSRSVAEYLKQYE